MGAAAGVEVGPPVPLGVPGPDGAVAVGEPVYWCWRVGSGVGAALATRDAVGVMTGSQKMHQYEELSVPMWPDWRLFLWGADVGLELEGLKRPTFTVTVTSTAIATATPLAHVCLHLISSRSVNCESHLS